MSSNLDFTVTPVELKRDEFLGSVKLKIAAIPKEACNAHGTLHASAIHTYLEVVGTFAVYTLDERINDYDGMPRTISVGTNFTMDYVSAAH